MQLLTKEIEAKFKEIGSQDKVKDPIIVVKFFNALGLGTWLATEYDPESKLFYGYVSMFCDEWGYFSLEELESLNQPLAFIKVERDILLKPKKFSKVLKEEMK